MASPASAPIVAHLRAAKRHIDRAAEELADPDLDELPLPVEARSSLAAAAVKLNLAINRESIPASRRPPKP